MTQTLVWQTPQIKDLEQDQLESNVVQPAIDAIEAYAVSWHLCLWALNGNVSLIATEIKSCEWPEGWDTSVRFQTHGVCKSGLLLERVMRYNLEKEEGSILSGVNKSFDDPGIIVFARSKPFNGYVTTVRRTTTDRVSLSITVEVKDESLFEFGWFKIT